MAQGTNNDTSIVSHGDYGGSEGHVTHHDSDSNSRDSYDIEPSRSGGWLISNSHHTNQNEPKGSRNRHRR